MTGNPSLRQKNYGKSVAIESSLSRQNSSVACAGARSLCCPIAHAQTQSCAWPMHPVATRMTLSRHKVKGTVSRQTFSVATKDLKWAVAHSGLLHLQVSFFLSFPRHPKFQHRFILCITKTTRKPGKLDKMHNLYRTSLITTQCSLITMHNWVFYPKFTKYKTRPDLVFFFKIEVLDELRCPLYLWHLLFLFP